MTHTLTGFQMKLFTSIAAATAVISASFIAATPSEARNGWIKSATSISNVTTHIKIVDRTGVIRRFHMNNVGPGVESSPFLAEAHCNNWALRAVGAAWVEAMPGSVNESTLQIVCR